MNSRIVGTTCQHNFAQVQRVLVSFQRKEANFFKKNKKIVTLTNFFYTYVPMFYVVLNKIPLNKTRKTPRTFDRSGSLDKHPRAFN